MLMHAVGLTGHTLLCCTLYVLVQEGASERLPFTARADLPDRVYQLVCTDTVWCVACVLSCSCFGIILLIMLRRLSGSVRAWAPSGW